MEVPLYYEIAAGIATKPEKVRVAALLNVISRDALDMYETFQWESEGDNFKIGKVLEKFEERCVLARNEIFERYNFFKRNQNKGESLDAYIITLLKLSETYVLLVICGNRWFVTDLFMESEIIKCDTRVTCNVMPFSVYKDITRDFEGRQLTSTKSVLMMHNKSRVFPRGTVSLQLDRNGHEYRVKFLIVDNCEVPLLSLVTSNRHRPRKTE